MNILISKLRTFVRDESGTTNIEYAIIATVVSVAAVALFDSMGISLTGIFGDASDNIGANKSPNSPPPPPSPPLPCEISVPATC